jgi:diketogulonate reductase-like aldo/keto reductase
LIHSPQTPGKGIGDPTDLTACWKILEEMKDERILNSIGVSNFQPCDLEALLTSCRHKPVVNQIEFHPYLMAHLEPLLQLQKQHGIAVAAYGAMTPVSRGLKGPLDAILSKIAKRMSESYGSVVDTSLVLLKWVQFQGAVCIVMSSRKERIEAMANLADLPDAANAELSEISRVGRSVHFRYYDMLMTANFPVAESVEARTLDGATFLMKQRRD